MFYLLRFGCFYSHSIFRDGGTARKIFRTEVISAEEKIYLSPHFSKSKGNLKKSEEKGVFRSKRDEEPEKGIFRQKSSS